MNFQAFALAWSSLSHCSHSESELPDERVPSDIVPIKLMNEYEKEIIEIFPMTKKHSYPSSKRSELTN